MIVYASLKKGSEHEPIGRRRIAEAETAMLLLATLPTANDRHITQATLPVLPIEIEKGYAFEAFKC